MKILFVNIMMGMYRGGGENFDLHLSRELFLLGHDIEFYYLQPVLQRQRLSLPSYAKTHPVRAPWLYLWTQHLHRMRLIGSLRGIRGFPRILGQAIFEVRTLYRLWRRRREEFVVHICGLSFLSMLATQILGNRVFLRFPGPPSLLMQIWCLKRTYGVIANGDAFEAIRRLAPRANLRRLDVGVDLTFFSKARSVGTLRTSLGLSKDSVLAIFVGRFVAIKNVGMLLRAFARLADRCTGLNLVLVGDGPDRADLESDASRLGLEDRVHFLGTLSGEHLWSCYAAADIFLLPSRYDNFPNVVLEAMAMELPVVATRVGGVPSQVDDGVTGFLVPSDDDKTMAERLFDLFSDKGLRISFGRAGLARIHERYDWRRTAELFLAWAVPK